MKVINVQNQYDIYDDSLVTYDQLPAQTYAIKFNKHTGFYLQKYHDFEIGEKVYGVHTKKIEKVFRTYEKMERNLGVMLSGAKGIGKSLFAKMLCIEAVHREIPVIIVDSYIPGIVSYIEGIEQEAVFLFDEFDKTFKKSGDSNPQEAMLSLFDGLSVGKKMFVVTCNEVRDLNDYLVNRPGRFHYHFRFDYPSAEEIDEYLRDKMQPEYYSQIEEVIGFSRKVNLNYDCLRAIAFELNQGEEFKDAILDLNILNVSSPKYNVSLYFTNGESMRASYPCTIDLFSPTDMEMYVYGKYDDDCIRVSFNTRDIIYDTNTLKTIIPKDNLRIGYEFDNKDSEEAIRVKSLEVAYLEIRAVPNRNLHYVV